MKEKGYFSMRFTAIIQISSLDVQCSSVLDIKICLPLFQTASVKTSNDPEASDLLQLF